ncbi:uncharacterized protein LOC105173454 isoform X2 [Sesamum indicum]|uniref:Uncharacterized protein LOC105173454 isoform X2 n=1 Tax=Sesamum indicum TaxID=4182 RepID=A0A6I9U0K6_SESIN|nr:uncharacterized protein LOC105173454 isoform X2 [Sesamum indicum]
MHLKKSEEEQIRRESSGVSSDFNPTPPLPPVSLYQKHSQFSQPLHSSPRQPSSASSSVTSPPTLEILIDDENKQEQEENESFPLKPTLFKRPHLQQQSSGCLTKNPTLSKSLDGYRVSAQNPHAKTNLFRNGARRFLSHCHQLPLRIHLVLSLPFLYFMVTYPSRSFILDFLFAFAFSYVLLFSLNLTVPRLPTIRLFFVRSLPVKIRKKDHVCQPHLPVVWSIGSSKTVDENVISLSGSHVQDYSNGDVYEGEFHEGKFSGGGVYYYHMSGRYEGDWIDGKHDGYGVETWAMGSRYRGQYRQGLRHGLGVYRFYTGDMYAGEWFNGQSNGWGMHTCADGSRYEGEFKWGVKHGLGHYHFRNGDRYAGEYFADKIHGFGIYYFANGHRYEGAWHEGRRQGLGTYTFRNGDTQSGHWQNGSLDVPSTQSTTYPVSRIAVNHYKEAQQVAEKAQAATKLDERVNKAVTAAVLAANAARVAAVKAVQKRMYHPMQK